MASIIGPRQAEDLTLSSTAKAMNSEKDTVVEKDIDGVPLRDSKKIDLKSILGHVPDVEDDEDESTSGGMEHQLTEVVSLPGVSDDADEYEYGYSDDGNEEAGDDEVGDDRPSRPVQRRSSLKALDHLVGDDGSESPKKVRFADALGLGLAAVRDLVNADEPPEIPHSALKDLKIRKKKSKLGDQFHLTLDFVQPSSDPDFMVRLQEQKVILENCLASDRELTVSGVVRVVNLSFDKEVSIRSTTDSWLTFNDTSTTYVQNSNDGATDRFMFVVRLPEGFGRTSPGSSRLEFAIEYRVGERIYWDNNDGVNYIVDCIRSELRRHISFDDHESSGSEGEFII